MDRDHDRQARRVSLSTRADIAERGVPDLSEEETSDAHQDEDQDDLDGSDDEVSNSGLDQVDDGVQDGQNEGNNCEDLSKREQVSSEFSGECSLVVEGLLDPVDDQEGEDGDGQESDDEGPSDQVVSVPNNRSGGVGDEGKAEGRQNGEEGNPPDHSSVGNPSVGERRSRLHSVIPQTLVGFEANEVVEVDRSVQNEPDSLDQVVGDENQAANENDTGEDGAWLAAASDGSGSAGSPGGASTGEEDTDNQPDSVPEEGSGSFSIVENPGQDHCHQLEDNCSTSKGQSQIGVSDFVLDVSGFTCEEIVSLQVLIGVSIADRVKSHLNEVYNRIEIELKIR